MDRIIFLDVDGVLNSYGTKDRIPHPEDPKTRIVGIDDFRVKLVSDLAIESGAKIVVSSTWREHFTLEAFRDLLISRGMDPRVEFVGVTPSLPKRFSELKNRDKEIHAWLQIHGTPEFFLILDDDPTRYEDRQVLTRESTGFFHGNMKRARKILGVLS